MVSFDDRSGPARALSPGKVGRLRAAWRRLAGEGDQARAVGEELLARWNEPHRRYHTLSHLWNTLSAVDVLQEGAQNIDAVRYAVWFHDAVYEGRPGEDEDESARLAGRLLEPLGAAPELRAEVERLVLLTKSHRPEPDDANGAVLCDADLSILGSEPGEYLTYTREVRAEYRHFSARDFEQGRLRFLETALRNRYLFHTEPGRRRWESRARSNMRAEADRLNRGVWGAVDPRRAAG